MHVGERGDIATVWRLSIRGGEICAQKRKEKIKINDLVSEEVRSARKRGRKK